MYKFIKLLTKIDIILVAFLISISIFLFIYFNNPNSNKIVEVYYQNRLYGSYPISKNKIIVLDKNIEIEIKNKKVRMLENTCKRQLCVKQGWSNSIPIICVPNKIMIKIISKTRNKMLISY